MAMVIRRDTYEIIKGFFLGGFKNFVFRGLEERGGGESEVVANWVGYVS